MNCISKSSPSINKETSYGCIQVSHKGSAASTTYQFSYKHAMLDVNSITSWQTSHFSNSTTPKIGSMASITLNSNAFSCRIFDGGQKGQVQPQPRCQTRILQLLAMASAVQSSVLCQQATRVGFVDKGEFPPQSLTLIALTKLRVAVVIMEKDNSFDLNPKSGRWPWAKLSLAAVFFPIAWVLNDRFHQSGQQPLQPVLSTFNNIKAPKTNVWADLSGDEISQLLKFLHEGPNDLNLTVKSNSTRYYLSQQVWEKLLLILSSRDNRM